MIRGKFYSKSGLNYIVVATIIVLFIILFLALVIYLIVNLYSESNGSIQTNSVNPDFIISEGSVIVSGNNVKLTIERLSGSDYNKGFQFILEDSDNNAEIVRIPEEVNQAGDVKEVLFTFNQISKVKFITLVPVKLDASGNEISYSPVIN